MSAQQESINQLIKRAREWGAERSRIMEEEERTGRLGFDAIQASDDAACAIARELAEIPTPVLTRPANEYACDECGVDVPDGSGCYPEDDTDDRLCRSCYDNRKPQPKESEQ